MPSSHTLDRIETAFDDGHLVAEPASSCRPRWRGCPRFDGQTRKAASDSLRRCSSYPTGVTVTAEVELVEIDGRRLRFRVECRDEVERGHGEPGCDPWRQPGKADASRGCPRAGCVWGCQYPIAKRAAPLPGRGPRQLHDHGVPARHERREGVPADGGDASERDPRRGLRQPHACELLKARRG